MSSLYTKTDLEKIYKTWYNDNDSDDEDDPTDDDPKDDDPKDDDPTDNPTEEGSELLSVTKGRPPCGVQDENKNEYNDWYIIEKND